MKKTSIKENLIIRATYNYEDISQKKQLYASWMLKPSPPHMNWNPSQNLCPLNTCDFEEIFP